MISRNRTAPRRRTPGYFGTLLVAGVLATGCTDAAGYDLDYILSAAPFVGTMRTSVAYEAQELPRLPPPNSVPLSAPGMDILPTFTQLQLDSVGAALGNPLPATPELLVRGEAIYQTNCMVCHGADGQGNGPVVGPGKYPLGPTLVGGTALTRSPGYIYGIIRVGRGLMPEYSRIGHNDRWAVAAYVQQLQQQAGGAPAPAPAPATPQPAAQQPGATGL